MKREVFAATNIGLKRKINQDSFLQNDEMGLYVVADGMGGHRGGEVASRLAVECIQRFCQENRHLPAREMLDQSINLSSQEIYKQSQDHEELSGMGTTVLALFFADSIAYIGQVGDSRAYLMNESGIWQITEDHSLLNEEIRAGRIAAGQVANYQFKNVITRSVGYERQVVVDIYHRKVNPNDIFILCTDGLSGLVDIGEIADAVEKSGPQQGLQSLIDLANMRGGDDNITLLICKAL